jgi:hypothetical protein
MNILILSYFFTPDFSAGSFRTQALINSISKKKPISNIYIFTSMPNRYSDAQKFSLKNFEELDVDGKKIKIFRSKSIQHKNSFFLQIISFSIFVFSSIWWSFKFRNKIDYIYATSSRFGTAFLGFVLGKALKVKVNLDIRDIFSDSLMVLSKNNFFLKMIANIIRRIENYVFKNTDSITFVSEGFYDNLSINKKRNILYVPNGIDEIFTKFFNQNFRYNNHRKPLKIMYAGNTGYAQGLHLIVPKLAKYYDKKLQFQIVGSGNAIIHIKKVIDQMKINNIQFIEPVQRKELINFYKNSNILFLTLTDDKAFEKVLPSKIFEYSAFDIPILAGVSGNAKKFILKEVDNSFVFSPNNFDEARYQIDLILNNYTNIRRDSFINKFNRKRLMNNLSNFLIENINDG